MSSSYLADGLVNLGVLPGPGPNPCSSGREIANFTKRLMSRLKTPESELSKRIFWKEGSVWHRGLWLCYAEAHSHLARLSTTIDLAATMDRVPAEIWLEIVSPLERRHIISLHQVSRSFHRICRPLLFKRFAFHPYANGVSSDRLTKSNGEYTVPGEAEIRRNIRRLLFWASDDVAPLVKECAVWLPVLLASRNVIRESYCWTPFSSSYHGSPRIKQGSIDAICSLPNLKEIESRDCPVYEAVTVSIHAKVARLSVFTDTTMQIWLSIINWQMLTHLFLHSPGSVKAILDVDVAEFPNVEFLYLRISSNSWTQALLALRCFPALRKLCMSSSRVGHLPAPTVSLFPFLDTYRGPHEFLVYFDPRATLRRLQRDMCRPLLVLQTMELCASPLRSITRLALSFDCLPTAALRTIVETFPALVHFRLEIVTRPLVGDIDTTQPYQSLFLTLAEGSPFSRCVESIAIVWWSSPDPDGVELIPVARAVWEALRITHPSLRWVHLAWPRAQGLFTRKLNGDWVEKINEIVGKTPNGLEMSLNSWTVDDALAYRQ
ncbi:hypothetical protein C8R45DRAFT_1123780 [Mycena sanguinolenta]|nr:hypothetical protein C8R45DRAFT_1123780 [Mycena sanguinolenta]